MAKKKPATSTSDPSPSTITVIKKANCKSLQQTTTLGFEIGHDSDDNFYIKIASSSGNGHFSKLFTPFTEIQEALEKWQKKYNSITSLSLQSLYRNTSVNTASFTLACLIDQGLLKPHPERKRHYQLADTSAFLGEMKKLATSHTASGKAKPKAKAKPGTTMKKRSTKAASGQ